MGDLLVLLDGTSVDDHDLEILRDQIVQRRAVAHVVVPARPASDHLVWTEGEARARARERLRAALDHLDRHGVKVTGEVGDGNSLDALSDALRSRNYGEVIVTQHRNRVVRRLASVAARRFGARIVFDLTTPSR